MQSELKDISDLHSRVGRENLPEQIRALIVPIHEDDKTKCEDNPDGALWSRAIEQAVVTSSELATLELAPRARLLGDWFCEGDLGIIYAFRGVGKTWLALLIARALSEGDSVGEWKAHARTKVLYIDGEMPADLMRDRDSGLTSGEGEIEFLNHEILFERADKVLNITNRGLQGPFLIVASAMGSRWLCSTTSRRSRAA
ncbi:MAG: AAA family ATPase [Chthoniobacterales bacterium]|nr:AAA family ATPase [Chthoniobacterales bacterium]